MANTIVFDDDRYFTDTETSDLIYLSNAKYSRKYISHIGVEPFQIRVSCANHSHTAPVEN